MEMNTDLHQSEIDILRKLAEKKADIARSPANLERRELWYRHNALESTRPMVLAWTGGVLHEIFTDTTLQCENEWARKLEQKLRVEVYNHEVLRDDHVVEPWIDVKWHVTTTPYVDESEVHIHIPKTENGRLGARRWDPPIADISRDFHKLHERRFSVDRESSLLEKERLEKIFAGILPVRTRGAYWWTMGMTWRVIDLIGMQNLMLFTYDDPEGLHRILNYMFEDHVRFADWLEREGLFTLNNENDGVGSGSLGYTRELPIPERQDGMPVRKEDLWVLLESQETVGVGPDQFEEFIFPYQSKLAALFGLCCYGCCEPVNNRWHILKRLDNLRIIAVSPWADEEFMATEIAGEYVYSRRPNPALISTKVFNEQEIRADIRNTFDIAKGCPIELLMKDVHTLNNQPQRMARWVEIAKEEIDRAFAG